jgi:formamidopyrimidine-DNA glycosylase
MPEGPEVETVRRSLEPKLVGRRFTDAWVSDKRLRRPLEREHLVPLLVHEIVGLGRKGKLFWVETARGQGVWFRLGMTGRVVVEPAGSERHKHCHVALALDGEWEELRFIDARRFGEVVWWDRAVLDKERARLGADPLSWSDDERLRSAERLWRTTRSVKEALLDQLLFAGVGNIYACEACFYAGVAPTRSGCDLTGDELAHLLEATEAVLREAVEHRGTTFSDFVDGEGREGTNVDFLAVFQREGEACPRCGAEIERIVQGGRSTFWCPGCQI